jgi:hypothetical protein
LLGQFTSLDDWLLGLARAADAVNGDVVPDRTRRRAQPV